jgi:hypothetical protein
MKKNIILIAIITLLMLSFALAAAGLTPDQAQQLNNIEDNMLTEADIMNIYNILFILHLLAVLLITGLKIYNVMRKAEWYGKPFIFILFGGYLVSWLIGFAVLSTQATASTNLLYSILFRISTFLLIINVVLFIAELLLTFGTVSNEKIEPYKSKI